MLSKELSDRLTACGITANAETALRESLEDHIETYTLFKLAPWPARRWKCHYRLMMRERICTQYGVFLAAMTPDNSLIFPAWAEKALATV